MRTTMTTRLVYAALIAMSVATPAMANTVALDEMCGDIVGDGLRHMPDFTDYVLSKSGADKLGFNSECYIGNLVFSQCWLKPKLSVNQAIDLLLAKARSGKKLPDTPACGA